MVEKLITSSEVAKMFAVDPKTVTRWAKDGKLPYITTPGGHRRFSLNLIEKYMREHHVIRVGADERPIH